MAGSGGGGTGEVEVVRQDGWAEVVLACPDRRNTVTGPMAAAVSEALDELGGDGSVALVLLRGAGGVFCAGLDQSSSRADPASAFAATWRDTHRALLTFPKPVVGALEDCAVDAGAALALACDLLVAGESAFLEIGEAAAGAAPCYSLAWLTLRHSEAVAAQLALLGQRAAGPELIRLGIAQRCVADDDVVAEARSLCGRLAGYPEGALTAVKQGLRARLGHDAAQWLDRFETRGTTR